MADLRTTVIQEFQVLIDQAQALRDKGWQHKLTNYRKVVNLLGKSQQPLTSTTDALDILRNGGMKLAGESPHQWKSKTLQKIEEIVQTGELKVAHEARNDPKVQAIQQLLQVPEVGPSKAESLYEEGIRTLADLKARPELLNRKQLIGLRHLHDLSTRIPRSEMKQWQSLLLQTVSEVEEQLDEGVEACALTGSYRRGAVDSGDIDFYLAVSNPDEPWLESLQQSLVDMGVIMEEDIISLGRHKMMAVASIGPKAIARHLDIFVFPYDQYPFALMFATGSGEFNVRFRGYALVQGWSLSDKGLFQGSSRGPSVTPDQIEARIGKATIDSELDIFQFLGVQYLRPEERTPSVQWKSL
jgi:DNA polymerase/3'-5' exonuclease PolX